MDFATLSLIIAGLAFAITGFGVIIEWKSIKISRGIQRWLMHESEVAAIEREKQPSIVDEFDEYMSEYNEEAKMTRLEAWGAIIGKRLFEAMKFSNMQALSVDARSQNRYDDAIHEGMKKKMSPMMKLLFKAAEHFGLDLDDIIDRNELPEFIQGLQNNGFDLQMLQRNDNPSSGKSGW